MGFRQAPASAELARARIDHRRPDSAGHAVHLGLPRKLDPAAQLEREHGEEQVLLLRVHLRRFGGARSTGIVSRGPDCLPMAGPAPGPLALPAAAAVVLVTGSGRGSGQRRRLAAGSADQPGGPVGALRAAEDPAHHARGDQRRGQSRPAGRYGFRGGPLFCTLHGTPVSDRYVRDMLRRLAAKAGLEKRVHPHGLRHTHAAELVREGVPVNVIRDQLGHASLAVTDRYLRNVAPADLIALGKRRTWTAPGVRP